MATVGRVESQDICRSIALSLNPLGSKRRSSPLPKPAESRKRGLARFIGQSLAGESNAPQFKDVSKTGAGLKPSNGLYALGAIRGNQCQIIVDTGSNISIVHPDVLK